MSIVIFDVTKVFRMFCSFMNFAMTGMKKHFLSITILPDEDSFFFSFSLLNVSF